MMVMAGSQVPSSHLCLGDDFHSYLLSLELTLLESGGARVTEVTPPHLFPKLVVTRKVLGEPEALVQSSTISSRIAILRYGSFIRFHRSLPPS